MAIVSVTGTIYGQTTNFTRDATTGKWIGTVTIPDHKGYTEEITLTATNSDGISATNTKEKIYIFILLSFITDRAQSDIDRVKELISKFYNGTITEEELLEWSNDLKGTLNKSDIQRIHYNLQTAITNYFSEVSSYTDDDVSDILDLVSDEFPLKEHFQYILEHLDALISWAGLNQLLDYDVPSTPSFPLNNIKAWNDIETIIEKIYLRTIDHHI